MKLYIHILICIFSFILYLKPQSTFACIVILMLLCDPRFVWNGTMEMKWLLFSTDSIISWDDHKGPNTDQNSPFHKELANVLHHMHPSC